MYTKSVGGLTKYDLVIKHAPSIQKFAEEYRKNHGSPFAVGNVEKFEKQLATMFFDGTTISISYIVRILGAKGYWATRRRSRRRASPSSLGPQFTQHAKSPPSSAATSKEEDAPTPLFILRSLLSSNLEPSVMLYVINKIVAK